SKTRITCTNGRRSSSSRDTPSWWCTRWIWGPRRVTGLIDQELHAFVGGGYLATLRYGPGPFSLDVVTRRWRAQPELLANEGGGFAVYVLIDEVVDGYLSIIEAFEDRADDLEDDVFSVGAAEDGGIA